MMFLEVSKLMILCGWVSLTLSVDGEGGNEEGCNRTAWKGSMRARGRGGWGCSSVSWFWLLHIFFFEKITKSINEEI